MPLAHIDLRELKKRGDVEGLINILNIGSIKDKREAAFSLGELKSKNAVKPLIGLLRKDDVQIRANAAWALGEIRNKDAVVQLIDLLNDTSQIVQLHAAWALGRIGDDRAVPDLYAAMKSSSGEFRKVAKDAIERIEEDIDTFKRLENISESTDLPLVALNIPPDFVFKYPSLEGESKLDGIIRIAKGVIIEDTGDGREKKGLRKVTVELENRQNVSVSIDILFRCSDRTTGETRSAWLQLASTDSEKLEENIELKNKGEFNSLRKPPEQEQKKAQPDEKSGKIDAAVKLLSDIGLSGVANAASTVTQLSGQEVQSQFRTIPIEQLYEEIKNFGDSIVLIEVRLHGSIGEMNGKMQLYLSKDTGIEIANELLSNPPESFCEDFNEDIISTLKETANIFGGQYVSAISEYIGVPILLEAPKFEIGISSKIAEAVIKEVNGKVEFVLATDLSLGKDKTGRLIMLLDPKSYDIIVSKLF